MYYFGRWDDPLGAEQEYRKVKDDLEAGRIPSEKPSSSTGITIKEICNFFLNSCEERMKAKKLSERSFLGYTDCCRVVRKVFGENKIVKEKEPGPDDFSKLLKVISKCKDGKTYRSCFAVSHDVSVIKSIFKFAYDNGKIDIPIRFGSEFKTTSKKNRLLEKAAKEQLNGKKLFEAEEIRKMLEIATPQMRCMILLGINCGYGNSDCSSLPLTALNDGWLTFPRPKTGVARRCPLWPETLAALQEVIKNRPKPAKGADANLIFLTKKGARWVRFSLAETVKDEKRSFRGAIDDRVQKDFSKLLTDLGIRRKGVGFYCLRHSFETNAGNSKDQVAVDFIMGHSDSSMAANYRHDIDNERLQAVVNHVRTWLGLAK